jgi:hypothetical protein
MLLTSRKSNIVSSNMYRDVIRSERDDRGRSEVSVFLSFIRESPFRGLAANYSASPT